MAIRDAALRFDSCREQALKAASLSKIKVNPKRHVHGREAAHVLLYEGLALKKVRNILSHAWLAFTGSTFGTLALI